MDNLLFGLETTLYGMGTVFLLLLVLMGVLMGVGRLDRPEAAAPGAVDPAPVTPAELNAPMPGTPEVPVPTVRILHDNLTADQIAAIAIAVMRHTHVMRMQAAPTRRTHQPGSHLYASRWVAVGRGYQNQSWRRR